MKILEVYSTNWMINEKLYIKVVGGRIDYNVCNCYTVVRNLNFSNYYFSILKDAKNNEFAFLHILMALMYSMWIPLPLALNMLLKSEVLQVGTLFIIVYLMMKVITISLQTGHIVYIVKHNEDKSITDRQGNYMMSTLSNPFELLVNIFICI